MLSELILIVAATGRRKEFFLFADTAFTVEYLRVSLFRRYRKIISSNNFSSSPIKVEKIRSELFREIYNLASFRAWRYCSNDLYYHFLISGLPYVRPMSPVSAVAGKQLYIKCPVAGYPIESIVWEKGKRVISVNPTPNNVELH